MKTKKSKTKTAMDYFNGQGLKPGQQVYFLSPTTEPQLHFNRIKIRQTGKSELFLDDWNNYFHQENLINLEIKIEYHKTYNGYTIGYYKYNFRRYDICRPSTYQLADMDRKEFFEFIKEQFNAVPKNHNKIFFRNEDDAKDMIDWIESLRLAYKMKEDINQNAV